MDPRHRKLPVYFKLIMDLILSSTPVSMRSTVWRLENLTLKKLKVESVITEVSLIQAAIVMRDNDGMIPTGIHKMVLIIMKTIS